VHKIVKAERVPSLYFAEACDRKFDANGRFVRHWKWAIKYAFPVWFRRYVELEEKAAAIRLFHPQLVPGLLQTEEYARAVLRTGRHTNLDDLVTLRVERARPEAHGRQPISLAATPAHVVQVIPYRETYHGWNSPFNVVAFDEGADVVHVDAFPRGYLLAEPDDVTEATRAYDLLKAISLPPDDSADLIDTVLREHYP
jgi:hypothetical protein